MSLSITKFIIISFIFKLIQCQLDPIQYNALVVLKQTLIQSWDMNNICGNINSIQCNPSGTVITKITFSNPANLNIIELPNSEIIKLVNLTEIYIPESVSVNSAFWTNIQYLNNLQTLNIYIVTSLPQDIGTYFPTSLVDLTISKVSISIPSNLFTTFRGKLSIGLLNGISSGNIYPTSIPSTSPITELNIGVGNYLTLSGLNFTSLTKLYIFFTTAQGLSYNLYPEFPQLKSLTIQCADTIAGNMPLPTSISQLTKVTEITIYGNRRLSITPKLIMNTPNLTQFNLDQFNLNTGMEKPIIYTLNRFSLTISNSEVDLSKLRSFYNQLSFINCNLISNINQGGTTADRLVMNSLSIQGNYSGTFPDTMCELTSSLTLKNTLVQTLPSCYICEWNSTKNSFVNNALLPYTQPSCPNFQIINYTTTTTTSGHYIEINGVDLGWEIYDQNYELVNVIFMSNDKAYVVAPSGTGTGKELNLRFHALTLPGQFSQTIVYNYLPPLINEVVPSGKNLTINGDNFTPQSNLITVYFAGVQKPIVESWYFKLIISDVNLPYTDDLVVHVKVIVDGQETSTVVRPHLSITSVNTPYANLYSGGGYLRITGEYLTFDSTIMNLTIGGTPCTLYKAESASSLIFKYPSLSPNQYTLVYTQESTPYSFTVQSVSQLQCKVVQGFCVDNITFCINGYTGPDCSSLPARLPKPTVSQQSPQTNSSPNLPPLKFDNQILNIKYSIYPVSVKEVSSNSTVVANYPISYSIYNQITPDNSVYIMLYGQSIQLKTEVFWYPNTVNIEYPDDVEVQMIQSTSRFQTTNNGTYVFNESGNTLQIVYQLDFESVEQNDVCSYYVSNILPSNPELIYSKSKINYIDFYTRVSRNNENGPSSYNLTPISKSPSKISMQLTLIDNSANDTTWGFDVTVLYDTKHAKQEIGSNCSSVTTTSPSPISCQGNPVCGGPTQGICQTNGTCTCINGYTGPICDSKVTEIPPTKPNPNTPDSDTETGTGVTLHISILAIRELDFQGKQEREIPINGWTLKQVNSTEKITYLYSSTLFNGTCLLNVTIDYFIQDSVVSFAGQNSTKLAGSIKYSAQITKWPFLKQINQLEVVFSSSIKDSSESTDSCSYKNIEYDESNPLETQSNVRMVYIQVNDRTFSTTFNNLAVVDGIPRQIRNVLLPNQVNDSNTQSNSLIGVLTPHHSEYIIIDPDFNLLVSYVDPSDKEGSICSDSDKKKLTKAQLAGIIVASSVVGVALICVAIYFIHKTTKSKIIVSKLKSRVSRMTMSLK
ncbi:hypothetical protein DLAC_04958 [Tieghemostelium lacteum]|uniref:EGF-like domain-containing protein n=1 Tax=Tieghemostelium lacteum TaxID=361077 RepID=A0A151ZI47_TIELA|nr:hypothetical protein DLAC_04958 [Tieghemostelium lacteum]|eukprot:KYQ93585.1 hypothetical protein DLAC_04958 [Tieghemostelium lacteum]